MITAYVARKQATNAELALLKLLSYIIAPSVNFENLAVFTIKDEEAIKDKNSTLKQKFRFKI